MLRVLSAGSTLHGLKACAAAAEHAAGVPLAIATDHGHAIRAALLRGDAAADVALLPADMVDALAAQDLLLAPVALGTVVIGGAARAGATAPAIGTMAALRAALVAADAVLLTHAPTGDHLMRVIAELGLAADVAAKLTRFPTSQKLLAQLATRGDSALGFSPETEIRAGTGVSYIGDVPVQIQVALPYAAAMVRATGQAEPARRLLQFLATAPARAVFSASGVRPPPAR
jgi:molybdate transport system substrate-binding protein